MWTAMINFKIKLAGRGVNMNNHDNMIDIIDNGVLKWDDPHCHSGCHIRIIIYTHIHVILYSK